jgi:hypothetical protein
VSLAASKTWASCSRDENRFDLKAAEDQKPHGESREHTECRSTADGAADYRTEAPLVCRGGVSSSASCCNLHSCLRHRIAAHRDGALHCAAQ